MSDYNLNGWKFTWEPSDQVFEEDGEEVSYSWLWCEKTFSREVPDEDAEVDDEVLCTEPVVTIKLCSSPIEEVYDKEEECWRERDESRTGYWLGDWEDGVFLETPDGRCTGRWGSSGLNALKHEIYDMAGCLPFHDAVGLVDTYMILEGWKHEI